MKNRLNTMKTLFLTSNIELVASDIASKIQQNHQKMLFITTAVEPLSENAAWYINQRKAIRDAGFSFTDYSITGKTAEEVEQTLKNYEILYVSGGNVFYLLEKIQKSNS